MNQEDKNLPCPQSWDPILSSPLMEEGKPSPGKHTGGGRKPGKGLLIGLAVICLIFVLPRFFSPGRPKKAESESDLIVYEHLLLGNQLPHMEDGHGQVRTDSLDCLHLYFLDVDQKKCDDYLRLCKSRGFQEDDHQIPGELRLFNSEGYGLIFSYIEPQDKLYVTLNAPYDFAPLSWPSMVVGDLIPAPQAEEAFVSHISKEQVDIYLKNMTPGQFSAYQRAAEEAGFNQEIRRAEGHFIAENANASKLYLTDEGGGTVRLALTIAEPDRLLP